MNSKRVTTLVLVATLAMGSIMRVAYLGAQVVAGDEIHAAVAAARHPLGYILTHFSTTVNSIPIAAWCRVLLVTVGLGEWGLRVLAFVPGILVLWVLTFASRRIFAPTEQLLFASLLSTSPILVLWSREGRPYGAVTFLAPLAVLALVRFAEERSPKWLAISAVCQAGLIYFSPTPLPFVGALALAVLIWSLLGGNAEASARQRLREVARLLAPAALGLSLALLLLLAAIPSFVEVLALKRSGVGAVTLDTIADSAKLVFGLSPRGSAITLGHLVMLPAGLALYGLVRFCRGHPRLALPLLIVLLTPMLAWTVLSFKLVGRSRIFVRYNAALVPFWLGLLVYGFGAVRRVLHTRNRWLGGGATTLAFSLVALLLAFGPLPSDISPRNYAPSLIVQSLAYRAPDQIPAFYRERAGDDDLIVVEWPATTRYKSLLSLYQQVHGGRVIRCFPWAVPASVELRTALFGLESAAERAPEGAYVVLHRRFEVEYLHAGGIRKPGKAGDDHVDAAQAVRVARVLFGRPVYDDEWITVFRQAAR